MKEYKLSAKSKYSVLYLLCGLFMFFFMFAILNLSSYAQTSSYTQIANSPSSYIEYTSKEYEFPSSYYHPEYAYPITTFTTYVSFTNGSTSAFRNLSVELHLVTSVGDFLVDQTSGTGTVERHTGVKVEGYPICYYAILKGDYVSQSSSYSVSFTYDISSVTVSNQTTNVTSSLSTIQSNTNQILSIVGGQAGDIQVSSNYSDYDSWSVENSLYSFTTNSAFGGDFVNSNSPFSFSFPNYSGTTLAFTNVVYFAPVKGNKYKLMFDYYNQNATVDFDISLWNNNGRLRQFSNNDFVTTSYGTHKFYILEFEFSYDDSLPAFLLFYKANCSATVTSPGIALYKRKYTIDDYMKFVKDNYDDITPSVNVTNQNTAQSMSDINTAQTFETSAFDNFNTQFSSSGLDTFSMSFASTPLLWVSSIITTFYNNMPSTFQYLLMFVAFVGILCTVLNVFGRVAQRFGGGDNATKLNGKDVFSKIEKNGSI